MYVLALFRNEILYAPSAGECGVTYTMFPLSRSKLYQVHSQEVRVRLPDCCQLIDSMICISGRGPITISEAVVEGIVVVEDRPVALDRASIHCGSHVVDFDPVRLLEDKRRNPRPIN